MLRFWVNLHFWGACYIFGVHVTFLVNVTFLGEFYIFGVNLTFFSCRDYIFTIGQFFDHMTRSQKLSRSKIYNLNPPNPLQNVNTHLSKC